MRKPDAVLIIGAGLLQVPLIQEAQALGLKVIATDGNPQAPGAALADAFLPIDTYDAETTAALVPLMQGTYTLRGVCTAGSDTAPTVSLAAERAGTPGIPYPVALRTHNKAEVRRALASRGLYSYQPAWLFFYQSHATRDHRIGYPCVVKPVSQRASRGVSIVPNGDALRRAVDKALSYGDEYLIEQCLIGTEHSAEAILDGEGSLLWFNIVDRPFDYSSGTGIELGHVNPTCLSPRAQQQMHFMLLACARALGVTWGPFKVDVMMTDAGPKVLECTARLSGGWDCQKTSPLTGRHPMRQLLQLSCGMPVDSQPSAQGYAACAAILPQKSGVVQTLPRPEPLRVSGYYEEIIWTIQPGMTIHPATHNGERAGYVLVHMNSADVVWENAQSLAEVLADALEVTTPLPARHFGRVPMLGSC